MKNKYKKRNHCVQKNKKWIVCPLLVVLTGIFLLPKIAHLSSVSNEKIIELTNKERARNGINEVSASQLLTKAAYDKALDLIQTQTFQHNINDRKFSAWIKDAGYEYSYVGENLAIDFMTSEGAIKAWLDSPTHKKNILNDKFTEIGVAVVEGNFKNQNTTLIVQIFGTPLNYANSQLTYLKNPEKDIPGFSIEAEKLLTNIESNAMDFEILEPGMEIYNPKNYLTILRINTAQAQTSESPSLEANYKLILFYSLIMSGLFFLISLFAFYLKYYRSLSQKNIKQ